MYPLDSIIQGHLSLRSVVLQILQDLICYIIWLYCQLHYTEFIEMLKFTSLFCLLLLLALARARDLLQEVPTYTAADISKHNSKGDIWVGSLDTNKVYDLSSFVHPGGERAILDVAGTVQEFTDAFNHQHGSSFAPKRMLQRYEIGDLAN